MKRAYYYLFYKMYKFSKAMPSNWASDWKAVFEIVALEIWLLFSFCIYYVIATKTRVEFNVTMPIVFIPALIIFGLNYLFFLHNNSWKDYIIEFDKLPKRTNLIGSWIVFGMVLLVIANFMFSFYLMSQIDSKQ